MALSYPPALDLTGLDLPALTGALAAFKAARGFPADGSADELLADLAGEPEHAEDVAWLWAFCAAWTAAETAEFWRINAADVARIEAEDALAAAEAEQLLGRS